MRPLIFLPGYYGSLLQLASTHERIWIDIHQALHPRRVMDLLRLDSGTALEAHQILDEIKIFCFLSPDIYKNLTGFLKRRLGYTAADLYPCPLDWRQSLDTLADTLAARVHSLPAHMQVDLLAHSHGGLVARAYMAKYGPQRVARLITMGTPHRGMLKVFEGLTRGIDLFTFKRKHTRPAARSFPSAYELLPRFADDGLVTWNGAPISPHQTLDWLTHTEADDAERDVMRRLLEAARRTTDQLLPNQLPVRTYLLYGTRIPGLNRAVGTPTGWKFPRGSAGDGTVASVSARGDGLTGDIVRCPVPLGEHSCLFDDDYTKHLLTSVLPDDLLPLRHIQIHGRLGAAPFYFPGDKLPLVVEVRDAHGLAMPNISVHLELKYAGHIRRRPVPQTVAGDYVMRVTMPDTPVVHYTVLVEGEHVPEEQRALIHGILRRRE